MAEAIVNTMEDLLTCSMCLELFKEPKTLLCLHSYCLMCLKGMMKGKEDSPIICPLCREETTTPPDGIEALVTNFFIKNLLDVAEMRAKTEDPQCSNCQDGLAAKCRCLDCEEFFCEQCLNAHQRLKANQDHKVVELQKLLSPHGSREFHPAMKCDKHEEVYKFYCQTCNVLVCRDCTVIDHPQTIHTVTDLKEVVVRYRQRFFEAMKKAEKHISKIKEVQEHSKCRKEELGMSSNKIKEELLKRKDYLIQRVSEALEGRVSEISSRLDQFVTYKLDQEEEDVKKQQADLKRMDNYVLIMRNLLQSGNDDEIMNMYKHLVRCLDDPSGRDPFWFGDGKRKLKLPMELNNITNDEQVDNVIEKMIERLDNLNIPKVGQYELTKEEVKDRLGKEIVIPINPTVDGAENLADWNLFQAKVLTPMQTVFPASIQRHGDGSFFYVHFTSYIEGRHRVAVHYDDLAVRGSPVDVEVIGDIDYSPNTDILQELPQEACKPNCKSFSAQTNYNGNIYILVEDKVYVLDANLNLLFTFGELGDEPGQMEFPIDIVIDVEDQVFLTDIGKHKILVFDERGHFLKEVGSKGEEPGQFNYPLGVAVDRCGTVAVCDTGNHRVQLFNPDGTVKLIFGNEDKANQMDPVAVAFNSQGDIIITESSLMSLSRLNQSHNFDAKNAVECVKIFDCGGQLKKRIGEAGEGKGQFWAAHSLTVDYEDHIWVAELSFGRIQVFDKQGKFIAVFTPDEEKKGAGWLSVLATAANGSILYCRSCFGAE